MQVPGTGSMAQQAAEERAAREAQEELKYKLRQEKKKAKQRGHYVHRSFGIPDHCALMLRNDLT
jgi:hypothetical protein